MITCDSFAAFRCLIEYIPPVQFWNAVQEVFYIMKTDFACDMNRVNQIIRNKIFLNTLSEIEKLEKERIFCCHTIDHLMDTARIMYIYALENSLCIKKEIIYAAALLHDIGRAEQYKSGIHHSEAGVKIASLILNQCGFTETEIYEIQEAIAYHKTDKAGNLSVASITHLKNLLALADKKSRLCMFCKASNECYWSSEKKNVVLEL